MRFGLIFSCVAACGCGHGDVGSTRNPDCSPAGVVTGVVTGGRGRCIRCACPGRFGRAGGAGEAQARPQGARAAERLRLIACALIDPLERLINCVIGRWCKNKNVVWNCDREQGIRGRRSATQFTGAVFPTAQSCDLPFSWQNTASPTQCLPQQQPLPSLSPSSPSRSASNQRQGFSVAPGQHMLQVLLMTSDCSRLPSFLSLDTLFSCGGS